MRNWNVSYLFSVILLISVASLPMRNWNICHMLWNIFLKKVASLPMRNWNKFVFNFIPYGGSGCEPTYEELKPRTTHASASLASGCEPTYEELKLSYSLIAFSLRHCCEPTYEELKRLFSPHFSVINSIRLRAYLWGIETFSELAETLSCSEVASLPMRNWNTSSTLSLITYSTLRAYLWGIETFLYRSIKIFYA